MCVLDFDRFQFVISFNQLFLGCEQIYLSVDVNVSLYMILLNFTYSIYVFV